MNIKKLEIKGFGKLIGRTYEFTDGLNVLFGLNEAGKSTLQSFIIAMLYGLKGGRINKDGSPTPLKRFKPWNSIEFGGAIEYVLDNSKFYRVERNFNTGEVHIYDQFLNDITTSFLLDKDRNNSYAAQHLGIGEDFFERTCFIRQLQIRLATNGSSELAARIANAIQTGSEDVSYNRAKAALEDALIKYVGTDRTSVRPLDNINREIQQLGEFKLKLEKQLDQRITEKQQAKKLSQERSILQEQREILEKIELYVEYKQIKDKSEVLIHKLTELFDEASEIEDNIEKIKLELSLIEEKGITTDKIEYELEDSLKQEVAANIDIPKRSNCKSKRYGSNKVKYILPMCLAVVALLYGIISGSLIAYAFTIVFLIPSIILWITSRRSGDKYEPSTPFKIQDIEHQRLQIELARDTAIKVRQINDQKLESEKKLSCIFSTVSALSAHNINDTSMFGEVLEEINQQYKTYRNKCNTLIDEICPSNIKLKLSEAMPVAKQIIDYIEYWYHNKIQVATLGCPEKFQSILCNEEITALCKAYTKKLDESVVEILLRSKQIEQLALDGDSEKLEIDNIYNKLNSLSRKKQSLLNTKKAIETALEVMGEAAMELQRDHSPVLNDLMSAYVEEITDGAYKLLKVDDKLIPKTISSETGNIEAVFSMSAGTTDQMYLALRLAMANLLSKSGETLPIILDEAFSQFDDNRLLSTLNFLNNLSSENQVIIFTCHNRDLQIIKAMDSSKTNILNI